MFGQLQKFKTSVNTEDKDHIAKIVAEIKFVSTTR